MDLDISSLVAALASLEKAVVRSRNSPEDEEVRDAVIQRFEYTIDLSWKMMQRVMKQSTVQESTIRTRRDLFRETARQGLIDEPERWFRFLEARNETSHTYKREVAVRVYGQALDFVQDARVFVERLAEKIHA